MKLARCAAALALMLATAVNAAPTKPARAPASHPAAPAASHPAAHAPAPAPAATPAGDALDAVAAMVNDEAVLVSDVEEQLYAFLQQSGAHPDSAQVDTLRRQVLDHLIDDRILQGEAKRQGITVPDADVDRQVDSEIAQARERIGGDGAFQAQLKREGLTESQLRDRYHTDLRKLMAVERLKQKQFPKRPVQQAEAEAYFKAHHDKFPRVAPEVRLQVIQLVPAPDSAAITAGLVKAQAIRKRIAAGEKFAKVAAETSEDPGSANAGGDLGFNARGHMVPEFDAAVFTLKLNEVSQPVRSPFGWHLIQVLERDTLKTAAGRDSLDEQGKPIPEAHSRHILVRLQPTETDISRSRSLAERIRDEARKGTSFTTLVRRYSQYQGPADSTGDVGFVPMGNMQAQLRAGLDTLEVGQVSDVLTNQAGFNVFKVIDRHPEREYTLDEVRADLAGYVSEMQRNERYEAWMKELRSKAQIEYR